MRIPARFVRASLVSSLLLGGVLALGGCPKHENFPAPLNVQPVPTPDSLRVERPDPQANDYDFHWYITDPDGVVDRVRIYVLGEGLFPDEEIVESSINPIEVTFPAPATGLRFAVSAISTEGVEGDKRVAKELAP